MVCQTRIVDRETPHSRNAWRDEVTSFANDVTRVDGMSIGLERRAEGLGLVDGREYIGRGRDAGSNENDETDHGQSPLGSVQGRTRDAQLRC